VASPKIPAASTSASFLATRLGRVDPTLFEVSKRHDDLGAAGSLAEIFADLADERRVRIFNRRRKTLRVKKHHARPADRASAPVARHEDHHEQVSFMVQVVLPILEIRKRLFADRFQEFEMLLSPFEGLFHRDHPVPEHACLWHQSFSRLRTED